MLVYIDHLKVLNILSQIISIITLNSVMLKLFFLLFVRFFFFNYHYNKNLIYNSFWKNFLVSERTYIAPSSNDIQQIVSTKWKIHDTLVHGLAASLGCQILFRNFRPTQGSHSKSDRLVSALRIRSGGIASSPERNKWGESMTIATKTIVSEEAFSYLSANSIFLLFSNSWSRAELVLLRVTVFTMPLKVWKLFI